MAPAVTVAEATCGVETRARKRMREDLDAQAGVAFPGLPFDVAVSLVEEHVPDPADLAVLRGVSRGMRDAVDATGRKVEEIEDEEDAAFRGYLRTLKCLRRRGRLRDEYRLCAAAARSGDLAELKALRAKKCVNTPHEYLEAREVNAFSTTRLTAIHKTGSRLRSRLLKQ